MFVIVDVDEDDAIHHAQSENPLQIIDTENEDELLFAVYRQYEPDIDKWLQYLSPEALEKEAGGRVKTISGTEPYRCMI